MNFIEYQQDTQRTAIYPGQGMGIAGLSYVALGLGNEVGEVLGKVKKIIRDDNGIITEEKKDAIIKELGDVLWYVSQVATEIGVDLHSVAVLNIQKLRKRKEDGTLQGSGDNR